MKIVNLFKSMTKVAKKPSSKSVEKKKADACPECNGSGLKDEQTLCPHCSGHGSL